MREKWRKSWERSCFTVRRTLHQERRNEGRNKDKASEKIPREMRISRAVECARELKTMQSREKQQAQAADEERVGHWNLLLSVTRLRCLQSTMREKCILLSARGRVRVCEELLKKIKIFWDGKFEKKNQNYFIPFMLNLTIFYGKIESVLQEIGIFSFEHGLELRWLMKNVGKIMNDRWRCCHFFFKDSGTND